MTEGTQMMRLTNNWLDTSTETVGWSTTTTNVAYCGRCYGYGCTCYHWLPAQTFYVNPTKVRLTMSDVEALRAAAKRDKALREALRKFTPHIEVEVDFG